MNVLHRQESFNSATAALIRQKNRIIGVVPLQPFTNGGTNRAQIFQSLAIHCIKLLAPFDFRICSVPKGQPHCGMEFTHFAVDAQIVVIIIDEGKGAGKRQGLVSLRARRNNTPAFRSMENLCGEKTTYAIAQKASALITRTESLRRIINESNAMFPTNVFQAFHITSQVINMDRQSPGDIRLITQPLPQKLR
ncbi:hypothetical protein AXF13_13890 [Desulfovibrio fairfieldensis]|uniref:Uncharacterized protein n=1 Tax=Desulfovibrio fairfieldensis TaxID=44742 RepID=A0A0X8JLT5_9BACT|nr:hypothetical protein AXF13_13890 [Desulfovibrio fairfieldensis]